MKWSDFTHSKKYILYVKPFFRFFTWYIFLGVIAYLLYQFISSHQKSDFSTETSLPNLLTTIGIMNAILITFIFSKLFAEKADIIKRKQEYNALILKVNAFIKIISSLIQNNFTQYISTPINFHSKEKLSSDKYSVFNHQKTIDGALNDAKTYFLNFKDVNLPNSFFLNKANTEVLLEYLERECNDYFNLLKDIGISNFHFNIFPKEMTRYIEDNIQTIYEKPDTSYLKDTTFFQVFKDMLEIHIPNLRRINYFENYSMDNTFNLLIIDFILSFILIIVGLLSLNISISSGTELAINNLIVSFFIVMVIDILKNVIFAIRNEINIAKWLNLMEKKKK